MIRVSQQNSAEGAKRYYASADYYLDGQEIVGLWGGQGAALLDLSGRVDKHAFEQLCDNLDPRTGLPLTVRTRSERTVGYDFTFSVPKSVSLLYGLTGDEKLLCAFREATAETMREMEAEMKTRVRRGGVEENRTTGNMVWAEFIHTTSRPVDGVPDPHLHAHVFVFNATMDQEENRWKAGQFRELKRDAPYFQAAFRVRLANRLQDLGYGVVRKKDDFEIAGIPTDILKRYSRRTALIEKVAQELGITGPDRKAELGAETREHKGKNLSQDELRQEWLSRLTKEERDWLRGVYRRTSKQLRQERGEKLAVDHSIAHSFVRDAVVPERKLMTEALKRGLGAVTVGRVAEELASRPLIRSQVDERAMATTKEMLALEEQMVAFARNGRGRCRPLGNPKRPITRDWLNDGQKAAVRHVLGSRDRVILVRGVAGTGKTTLEQEIGEAIEEAGKPVVALAQSIKASRGVLREEAGFATADTLARFLSNREMQQKARGGVILVDEASQLGTRDMQALFSIAESVDARVLLVGDRRQHRSVTAGEPLKLLEERSGLPVAEVTEILRQQGDYKKAASHLSEGRIAEAFDELDKLGWIRQAEDADRYKLLAEAYQSAASELTRDGKLKTALVVTPTHAEAAKVTEAIRSAFKQEGRLSSERIFTSWVPAHLTDAQKSDATQYDSGDLIQFQQNAKGFTKGDRIVVGETTAVPVDQAARFELYRPKLIGFAVGDRIRLTAGGTTKDGSHRLANGAIFTIEAFSRTGDLMVNDGWVIDREFGHFTHGYVTTSHASQGTTVHKVFVAISGDSMKATDQRTAYVALTRGREQAVIFTDDIEELLKVAMRKDTTLSATELAGQTDAAKPVGLPKRKRALWHNGMMPEQNLPAISRQSEAARGDDYAR